MRDIQDATGEEGRRRAGEEETYGNIRKEGKPKEKDVGEGGSRQGRLDERQNKQEEMNINAEEEEEEVVKEEEEEEEKEEEEEGVYRSVLELVQVGRKDEGEYTCHPSMLEPVSVKLHILGKPLD